MPVYNAIGYGDFTEEKINHLAKIFKMHIGWTAAVLRDKPYWKFHYHYIDATAGCGHYPDSHLPGSPLVFLRCVNGTMPYNADFIEREPGNYMLLLSTIPTTAAPNVQVHCGDYGDQLPDMLTPNKNEFGLVFIDHSGDVTPLFRRIPVLEQLAIERPRMEILIYIAAANVKRCLYQTDTRLEDYLQGIKKRHWLVREPMGKHQWTFLMGSNTPPPEYKAIGFHRLDSTEGQEIFNTLNFTNREREQWDNHIGPMQNTCNIPNIGLLEQKHLPGLEESANTAKSER